MADTYIDYREVTEYGRHFLARAATLESVSGLPVDIARLRTLVEAAIVRVETERDGDDTLGSSLRVGQSGTVAAAAVVRSDIRRFFFYLQSLPDDVSFDMASFFDRGKLGSLEDAKPADVLDKAKRLLHAFNSPANTALPGSVQWRATLDAGRTALDAALTDKINAKGDIRTRKSALAAARLEFLRLYNRIAKRLIRAALIYLDREGEYRQFFLDLQVNEHGGAPRDEDVPTTDERDTDTDIDTDIEPASARPVG